MTAVMTDAQERKPWDRMQGEPFDWHARFQIYRDQGPSRSLAKAYREWTDSSGKPSKTTKAKAKEWRWEERALAFDQHQREGEAVRADAPPHDAGGRRRSALTAWISARM